MDRAKKFRIAMFITISIGVLLMLVSVIMGKANLSHDDRSNTECLTNTRIFDYADKLTASEESELTKDIEELENKAGMDVVIVTIDESTDLSDIGINNFDSTRTVAETFCDYYRFGWEKWSNGEYYNGSSAGTSIVIVTNWAANAPYENAYMCTSGRAWERIGDDKASDIVQYGCEILRDDTLGGFQRMLGKVYSSMKSGGHGVKFLSPLICFIAAVVCAVVFCVMNMSKKAGKDTTSAATYAKGNAQLLDRRDIFIRKEVHSVKIQTSSGGGSHGGGGGGGGSHGGGGGHF